MSAKCYSVFCETEERPRSRVVEPKREFREGCCFRCCGSHSFFNIWPFIGTLNALVGMALIIIAMCTLGWAVADTHTLELKVGLLRFCSFSGSARFGPPRCVALDSSHDEFHSAGVTAFVLLVVSLVCNLIAVIIGLQISWQCAGRVCIPYKHRPLVFFTASVSASVLAITAFVAYASILYPSRSYRDLNARQVPFSWVYSIVGAGFSFFCSLVATVWLFCWSKAEPVDIENETLCHALCSCPANPFEVSDSEAGVDGTGSRSGAGNPPARKGKGGKAKSSSGKSSGKAKASRKSETTAEESNASEPDTEPEPTDEAFSGYSDRSG